MSINHHKIQKVGWYPYTGTTPSATEITSSTKYYNAGIREKVNDKLPIRELDVMPLYRGLKRDPDDWVISKSLVNGSLGILPYNGIWLYYTFGNSVTTADAVGSKHTITGIDTGRLPQFEYRWQSQTDDQTTPTHLRAVSVVGCKVSSFSASIDLTKPVSFLAFGVMFSGTRQPVDTYANNWTPINLPNETNETVDFLPYLPDNNMVIEYQPDGSPIVDLKTATKVFNYTTVNNVGHNHRINKLNAAGVIEGNRLHTINLTVARGEGDELYNSFYNITESTTTFNDGFKFKIYQAANKYIELNFSGIVTGAVDSPEADLTRGEEPVDTFTLLVKSVTAVVNDGVSKTLYGE